MINPFDPKSKEREELKALEQEVRSELKELSLVAKDLVNDTRYKKFSELLVKAEDNTVSLFLAYRENDPIKYKAKVDEYLIELRVYRNLLNTINDLANPKPLEKFNLVQNFKNEVGTILNRIK